MGGRPSGVGEDPIVAEGSSSRVHDTATRDEDSMHGLHAHERNQQRDEPKQAHPHDHPEHRVPPEEP